MALQSPANEPHIYPSYMNITTTGSTALPNTVQWTNTPISGVVTPMPIMGTNTTGPWTVTNPYRIDGAGLWPDPCDSYDDTSILAGLNKLCDRCGWHEGKHAPVPADEEMWEMRTQLLKMSERLKD